MANLGLQGIGLMREKMNSEIEKLISKCNSNDDIRKIYDENRKFTETVNNSVQPIKELIEDVLTRLSLKDKPASQQQKKIFQDLSK